MEPAHLPHGEAIGLAEAEADGVVVHDLADRLGSEVDPIQAEVGIQMQESERRRNFKLLFSCICSRDLPLQDT